MKGDKISIDISNLSRSSQVGGRCLFWHGQIKLFLLRENPSNVEIWSDLRRDLGGLTHRGARFIDLVLPVMNFGTGKDTQYPSFKMKPKLRSQMSISPASRPRPPIRFCSARFGRNSNAAEAEFTLCVVRCVPQETWQRLDTARRTLRLATRQKRSAHNPTGPRL